MARQFLTVKDTSKQFAEADKRLAELIRAYPDLLKRALREELEERTLPLVRTYTPEQTGRLKRATRVAENEKGKVVIENDTPYAAKVHEDTQARQRLVDGRRGPKFISRAVTETVVSKKPVFIEAWRKRVERAIEKKIRGTKVTTPAERHRKKHIQAGRRQALGPQATTTIR
ncbi:MAG: hypothetical protein Q9M19_04890 [Mariprofundaceae bacterium]|nr:hypothetical protein [Mariprofundaceae bacterium]